MTTLTRALALVGSTSGLADYEILAMLAKCEKKMGREFSASEGEFFQMALNSRRITLEKLAGIEQPKFVAAAYGQARMTNTQDQPEGSTGE